jgi:hypothetical protein
MVLIDPLDDLVALFVVLTLKIPEKFIAQRSSITHRTSFFLSRFPDGHPTALGRIALTVFADDALRCVR